MQIRTFTAKSQSALLAQIRAELGPDAIILDSKQKDGVITMTAALERPQVKKATAAYASQAANAAPIKTPAGGDMAEALNGMGLSSAGEEHDEKGAPPGWRQWHQEWDSIKHHILALMKPALKLDELTPRQRVALEFLQREGINDEATLAIVQQLKQNSQATVLEPLGSLVKVRPWGTKKWPERIHIFTGPFGAGKTTAAIRMALELRKDDPKASICLINADASRGNGRLLLRHYSELSDLSYKESSSTIELVEAVVKAESEGFDKIFIDFPGLPKGKKLSQLLEDAGLADKDAAVHLTLAPHYSEGQIAPLLGRYKTCLGGSIIWTKLDEAEHFGSIVNVALLTSLPVSALSYGAGIGNSLVAARETMLWRLLFKGEMPGNG